MIKNYLQFINEKISQSPENPDEKIMFHLKSDFVNILKEMQSNIMTILYLNLINGVERKYLVKDPVDYLNVDDEGNISFLKSRYFDEDDKWESNRRQKKNIKKVIKDIYNESYLSDVLKQTDVESFINKWNAFLKPVEVIELRGEDMLRAYNYTNELDPKTIGDSCANFVWKNGKVLPEKDRYDIYTKNPENIGVVVVIDKGFIVGRRTFQQGIQTVTIGEFKKGNFYTVWGNFYGITKYDHKIKDYLTKKYNAIQMQSGNGNFRIRIKETRFYYYCAFDSMFVDFYTGEISDGRCGPNFVRTYGAMCPSELLKKKRDEEEKEKKTKLS